MTDADRAQKRLEAIQKWEKQYNTLIKDAKLDKNRKKLIALRTVVKAVIDERHNDIEWINTSIARDEFDNKSHGTSPTKKQLEKLKVVAKKLALLKKWRQELVKVDTKLDKLSFMQRYVNYYMNLEGGRKPI